MSEVVDHLRAARELISDPLRWTQGWFAKTVNGTICYSSNPAAVCWCARGAVSKTAHGRSEEVKFGALDLLSIAASKVGGCAIEDVNDNLGYDATLKMFDNAIKLAEDIP